MSTIPFNPEDYLGHIPPINRNKPKFVALVSATLQPLLDSISFLSKLIDPNFDIDTAIGVQLDILGVIVGRSRYLNAPVSGVYFSFGIAGLGWHQGYWKGQFDPSEGLIRLDDDTYREVLKFKIVANSWDGTYQALIQTVYALTQIIGSLIFIQDNQDMSITVGIVGRGPNALAIALLKSNYLTLKPEGVRIAGYKISSTGSGPLFGFGMNNVYVSGWGIGSWAADA